MALTFRDKGTSGTQIEVLKGGLQIAEVPGERPGGIVTIPSDGVGAVRLSPKVASKIIAELEDPDDIHG